MGAHLDENGVFSNDKYSDWCPPGFVPLKLTGTPLWDYAWCAPGFVPLKIRGSLMRSRQEEEASE
jgi:hypothetical protein